MSQPLLQIEGLRVTWPADHRGGAGVEAVRGVDLNLAAGETLALVGGSGSGKTSLAKAVLGLIPSQGQVRVEGRELSDWLRSDRAGFRRKVQLLMQNPGAALNPRMSVGAAIAEVLSVHRPELGRALVMDQVAALLQQVELPPEWMHRLPHQMSGGERQRASLARALAVGPDLLILDEPVSSLDAEIRSRILDVLKKVQQLRRLAYLYIAHDLAMVASVCERVAVMHEGEIVEAGETAVVFSRPAHVRTRELLMASPAWEGSMRA